MNIFNFYSEKIKAIIINNNKILNLKNIFEFKGIQIESPPEKFNCDLSTNIPMIVAKQNKINPIDLANKIKTILEKDLKDFKKIELAGPGFLNITLTSSALINFINTVIKSNQFYGSNKKNKNYNIEFVSANPTGPMHVGHCRGAIYGDVLSNLLKFNGNKVVKEYYINDYGNQIVNFTKSVYLRLREIKFNEKFTVSKDLYPGEYIVDIAKNILISHPDIDLDNITNSENLIREKALESSMSLITSDLHKLGIRHDNFVAEKEIVKKNLVTTTISALKDNNFIKEGYLDPPKGIDRNTWKKTKRLIFKSTDFGDDADRALQKNDGTWTYFANDIAYHADKVSRGYDYLINVLGADHIGYIKRISSAVSAISNYKTKLDCKVCQLVKLYKNGKPFKMSKRAGDFVSVSDLLSQVDKDSIRFMMLNRSNDVELDFDFDKVIEKNKENPVFYVQYCYARINSIFRTANIDASKEIKLNENELIFNAYEKKLLRKIFDWPKIIESSAVKYEPHKITFYLYDVATLFHSYWSRGNENDEYKFIKNGKIRSDNTLIIIKLLQIVIRNGMKILGVSLPNKM